MPKKIVLSFLFASLFLAGCSSVPVKPALDPAEIKVNVAEANYSEEYSAKPGELNKKIYKWETLGIGQAAGMQTLAFSPVDKDIMMLGGDMSGAYMTYDGAETWSTIDTKQISGILPCTPVFHPKDAGTVYCAGGGRKGWGLKVSKDKGKTWDFLSEKLPSGNDQIFRIYLDRDNPEVMFYGTEKASYKSKDSGKTWKECAGVTGKILNFLVDQSGSKDKKVCFAGTSAGVFKSEDYGETWAQNFAQKDLKSFAGGSTSDKCIIYLLAGYDIYRSKDKGKTWDKASDEKRKAVNPCALFVAENTPEIIYVTHWEQYDIYKSSDAGDKWKNVYKVDNRENVQLGMFTYEWGKGYSGPLTQGTNICPSAEARMAGCGYGELLVTKNGGKNWKYSYTKLMQEAPAKGAKWSTQGLEESSSWNYCIDPHNKNIHYICYTDIFYARSEDAGKSWSIASAGSPWQNTVYNLAFDETPGVVYAAASNEHDIPHWLNIVGTKYPGGVLKSTDFGKTWTVINDGLPLTGCTDIMFDKTDNSLYAVMYAHGVFKSADRGKTWVKKSNGLVVKNTTDYKGATDNTDVYTIKKDKNGIFYCVITAHRIDPTNDYPVPGGLFRSKDKCETWECVTTICDGKELRWPIDFDIHPDDPNTIYIAAMGSWKGLILGGTFKTTDGGKTWKDITAGITPAIVYPFKPCIEPKNPEHIWLTSEGRGLLESKDGGKTWFETNFPFGSPQRILFDYDTNMMYVSTFGGGVWKKSIE